MAARTYITEKEKAFFFADGPARELINRLDLNILVGGLATGKADLDIVHSFRADPYFRFYYIVDGGVDVFFADGKYSLKPGYMYLMPVLQPFCYGASSGFSHYWLHFCSAQLEKIDFFQHLIEQQAPANTESLMQEFLRCAEDGTGIDALMQADIVLRKLLVPFLRIVPDDAYQQIKKRDGYAYLIEYINRNLAGALTIPVLARMVGKNRNDFTADFHQAFGISPKQYICARRIGQAKILLLNSKLTIKQISCGVGYENEFFFYRIFKKYTGQTPTEFRSSSNLGL